MKRLILRAARWVRHHVFFLLALGLVIGSLVLLFWRYSVVLERLVDAFRDFGTSFVYYFRVIFFGDSGGYVPTLNELPEVDLASVLEIDVVELQRKLAGFPDAFFVRSHFRAYNIFVSLKLNQWARFLVMLLPLILIVGFIIANSLLQVNTDHGQKTKPLRFFLRLTTNPYRKTKVFLSDFWTYFKPSLWFKGFIFLWLLNLNLFAVLIEFLAFYFFFACTISVVVLPIQLVKLLIDLLIMFSALPFFCWVILGFLLFDKIRRHIGREKLRRQERRNRGVLNELPVCLYIIGRMGSKKTMTLTDMILSINAEFRDRSLGTLCKIMKRFPNFPWILFERQLREAMAAHVVTNLASVRIWVESCREIYEAEPSEDKIFGYNTIDNPIEYDDGLTVCTIWEELSDYACAFFIFVIRGSYSMSNFSVRFDTQKTDYGNLPLYNNDFFDRNSYQAGDDSTYSHIMEFDLFRLGRTMIEDSEINGSFEFGIYSVSEVAKERGNQLDTRGLKKSAYEANQLNDLFNYAPKLARHPATVDYYPYVRFFFDDQRSDSLGADLRELCATVDIIETSELQLAMPGFVFEDMLCDLFFSFYDKFHRKLRNLRGDSTLTGFLLDNLAAFLHRHRERVYNTFGFYRSFLLVDDEKEYSYFLANKKVLANRFATDCFADFFSQRSVAVGKSMDDYPSYAGSRATLEELQEQHSYFIRDLTQIFEDYEEEETDFYE